MARRTYLPDDIAERVGVIRGLGSRLPPGLGVGDHGAHLVPVTQVLRRGIGRYAGYTNRVRQDVPYGGGLLAVGTELRP